MDFSVARDCRPGRTVLVVRGELDVATVPELREQVAAALTSPPALLYVDLSEAAFIDSTGCRELVRAAKSGAAAGVPVELVVPVENWRVRRVVDFMQFDALLPVHDTPPYA